MDTATATPTVTLPNNYTFVVIDEVSAGNRDGRMEYHGTIGIVTASDKTGPCWMPNEEGDYRWTTAPTVTVHPLEAPERTITLTRWHDPSSAWLPGRHEKLLALYAQSRADYRRLDSAFSATLEAQTEHLHRIAEEKGFCSEFDDFVDRMNADCPGPYYIEAREVEYRVTVRRERTITEENVVTVFARANADSSDLYEIACDIAGDSDYWSTVDEDTDDYEVTDWEVA